MIALFISGSKGYNLALMSSVQLLTPKQAEITIDGKPLLLISREDMTLEGVCLALSEAVERGKPVTAEEVATAAVKASTWRK